MDDFLSYRQQKNNSGNEQKNTQIFDWGKEFKKASLRYNGRGEGEIMKEIFARATQAKKAGTLTNEQIDEFYLQFSAALDGARRKRLKKLIDELKQI